MTMNQPLAALFDLDGVVFDTERQYTVYWQQVGQRYHPTITDFAQRIKGRTLVEIFQEYFDGQTEAQAEISRGLVDFESRMHYDYIPGVEAFLDELRRNRVPRALVTSSNRAKMACAYRARPELTTHFDAILVAEDLGRSKPHPDGYLRAAERLGVSPTRCVVFEDSFSGLEAGRRAGGAIVGLATTNPAEAIATRCDRVIPDFRAFTVGDMVSLIQMINRR